MGVHGLTTYLRENKRLLSVNTVLNPSLTNKSPVPIVVDGWSFIYNVYNSSHLPWVYGGEYTEFVLLVTAVVESWIKVGILVYFVFDGACPETKFPTVIARLNQSHVFPAQIYFRTSATSRNTGRFLSENRILPPLAYSACVNALLILSVKSDRLHVHFADEEGDPYAVELAGRLEGYVVGNDSDFVILNSPGYRGYIPLDEMVWQSPRPEPTQLNEGDDDFQTVVKPKSKKNVSHPQTAGGLLSPDNLEESSFSFTSYSPEALAQHLDIPASLLPLFGALVGNDYSKESESNARKIQALFFDRRLSLSGRITKVADILHSVISQRKAKQKVGSVMDLIDKTVNSLLSRLVMNMGSGEVEAIVEKVVSATLQYAIPKSNSELSDLWPTAVCALHTPESCPIFPIISRNVVQQTENSELVNPSVIEARDKFLDAYRKGFISSKIMDLLNTSSSWARLFLENPDLETVGRSIGRPIREWVHTILNDTVGLPLNSIVHDDTTEDSVSAESSKGDDDSEDNVDDDELIDVVESSDESELPSIDFLAPLKGELQRLHSKDSSVTDTTSASQPLSSTSIVSHRLSPKLSTVTEYIRRGSRVGSETVPVRPLQECLSLPHISLLEYADETAPPLLLRSAQDRLILFLRILQSDLPSIRQLPSETILAVLAVRWVVRILDARWHETGSKEREKERWIEFEARCFLSSFTWAWTGDETPHDSYMKLTAPPIEERNIQLTAQILMALESIEQLAESLLLLDLVPRVAHLFSGKAFHGLLTRTTSLQTSLPSNVWEVVEMDLLNVFQPEKAKKARKSQQKTLTPNSTGPKANSRATGMFSLLDDQNL